MKAEARTRLIITAETKQDLAHLKHFLRAYPEAGNLYWLVIDLSRVDTSCDIRPIGESK